MMLYVIYVLLQLITYQILCIYICCIKVYMCLLFPYPSVPLAGGWWDFPPEVDEKVKEAKAAGLSVVTCVIRRTRRAIRI